ncbi:MAG: hypothetical protein LBK54_02005 [Propionibacteriaceae bacterium]|nr:hypothetical protein [Propionibacteriaceae bacterium]
MPLRRVGPTAVAGLLMAVFLILAGAAVTQAVQREGSYYGGLDPSQTFRLTLNGFRAEMDLNLNRTLFESAEAQRAPVRLQVSYGDHGGLPGLAVFDSSAQPTCPALTAGRCFSAEEMRSDQVRLLLQDRGPLVDDPSLGGAESLLPTGSVIGAFDAAQAPGVYYIVNLSGFRPTFWPGRLDVEGGDPDWARRLAADLSQLADVGLIEPQSWIGQAADYRYTTPSVVAALVSAVALAVLVADAVKAESRTWLIQRRLGASNRRLSRDCALAWGLAGLSGASLGGLGLALTWWLGPSLLGPAPPGPVWLLALTPALVAAASAGLVVRGSGRLERAVR